MIDAQVKSWLEWLGAHANVVLLVVLLIVAGSWGFIELLDEVQEGDTQAFDEWAVRALRQPPADTSPQRPPDVPLGPPWLQEVGRDITALGGVAVLTLVTLFVAGYLLMIRKYHAMWLVLAASIGGLLISSVLKWLVDRPRPSVHHFSHVYTTSFPSGHAMLSAVVYLTLGALLTRLTPSRRVKLYFLGIALLLTGMVGLSRIYMGVHYPTDVLAGWSAGLVWALLCWLVARRLQRKGKVEKDQDDTTDDLPQNTKGQAA